MLPALESAPERGSASRCRCRCADAGAGNAVPWHGTHCACFILEEKEEERYGGGGGGSSDATSKVMVAPPEAGAGREDAGSQGLARGKRVSGFPRQKDMEKQPPREIDLPFPPPRPYIPALVQPPPSSVKLRPSLSFSILYLFPSCKYM